MSNNDDVLFPGEFKRNKLGRRASWWYWRLTGMVLSNIQYVNLPPTVDRDYIEKVLFGRGRIVWTRTPEEGSPLRALDAAFFGYDCYNYPTGVEVVNPVIPQFKREIGVNAVLMRNNKMSMSSIPIVREYALQLAQLDVDLEINLDALKTAVVFHVENGQQARQVRELYERVLKGEPAVITDSDRFSWTSDGNAEVFNPSIPYHVTQLLSDRRTLINDFLTQFGVNNVALEKRERLVTGEISGNDQELAIMADYWLEPRREAVAQVNAMFGTNISVRLRTSDNVENDVESVEEGAAE